MRSTSRCRIIEVTDVLKVKEFNEFPSWLYRNDPNWCRPLDSNVEEIFNKNENKHLKNGDIIRWIVKDNDNRCLGRIAAFYTEDSFRQFDKPTGGIGFFDAVDDKKVAFLLFDTAKEWLQSNRIETMDGPYQSWNERCFLGMFGRWVL